MEQGKGKREVKTFKTTVEIYYEDTDTGGVVYYANYLKFFERARTRALKELGVDPAKWMRRGVVFTVTRAEVDYKGPAEYGDRLLIETEIEPPKGARLAFTYKITKETGKLVVKGRTNMACVNSNMKPQRIPQEILDKIE